MVIGPAARSLLAGLSSTIAGQAVLVAFESQTRAASGNIRRDGIAYLAPDSLTYLADSSTLSDVMSVPWNRWLYIALLYVGERLGDASTFIVLLQLSLAVIGAAVLHSMTQSIGGGLSGSMAAIAFTMNPLTAQWFRFVLTETIFYVLVILTLHSAWRLLRHGPRPGAIATGLLTAGLAVLARPNGILVAAGLLTVIVFATAPGSRRRWTIAALLLVWTGAAAGLVLGVAAAGGPAERSFAAQLSGGIVIEGDERVVVSVAMPPAEQIVEQDVSALARYVLANPQHVAKLIVARIITESAQVRPHYALLVNVAVGGLMAAYSLLALFGWRRSRERALSIAVVSLGLPLALLVGVTFAVPEGRYGWSYLILLAPFVGIGADRLLRPLHVGLR